MLHIIVGKSGTGKSSLEKELSLDENFNKVVLYTTRPMRDGEEDGVEYHYISQKDFDGKCEELFFDAIYIFNGWGYGVVLPSLEDINGLKEFFVTLAPPMLYLALESIRKNSNKGDEYLKRVAVQIVRSKRSQIEERLKIRGSIGDTMERRMRSDDEDFMDLECVLAEYGIDFYYIFNIENKKTFIENAFATINEAIFTAYATP